MALLSVRDVVKGYDARQLLRGVTLQIEDGERVGLLGRNGTGKSTLLRILAGQEAPDSGERVMRRDLRLGYLEQEPYLNESAPIRDEIRSGLAGRTKVLSDLDEVHEALAHPELTTERMESLLARQARLEDRLALLGGHDVEHRVEWIADSLRLPGPDTMCGVLSGGERRRVALARLLLSGPELLLLDEPTNHLDALVVDWLEDFLLETETPLLMVTHDRYFLDRVVHRIVELDRGELRSYEGGYGDYLVQRAARLEAEERAEQSRLNILRRETAWMKRGPPARTTKAKARIRRYAQIVSDEREAPPAEVLFSIPPGPKLGNRALRLQRVAKRFGDRTILEPLDLELGPGTRLGVVGRNGAGKSTLLKICSGELAPDSGTVDIGPTTKIAAVDQLRTDLDPNKTVIQEVAGPNDHVKYGDRLVRVESFLDQLLFPGPLKHALVGRLSGGERNRLMLAKLLTQAGNLLILDEPTNDLDLATLRVLEEAILEFPGAVIVVSHDRYFLDRVANKVLYLDGNGKSIQHEGAVSDLLKRLGDQRTRTTDESRSTKPAASESVAAPAPESSTSKKKLSYREKQELDALPAQIAAAEETLAVLDRELSDPSLYEKPGAKLEDLTRKRSAAQARVDTLYSRWQQLEEP